MPRKSAKRQAVVKQTRWRRDFLLVGGLFFALAGAAYLLYLDHVIRNAFEGKRWALPASVYARPLELFPGARIGANQLEAELSAAAYQKVGSLRHAGQYLRQGSVFELKTRAFRFSDGDEPSRHIKVSLSERGVSGVREADGTAEVDLVRLDPALIGRFVPSHNEDRDLVKLDEVPRKLTDLLIAVEDRRFYDHWGLDPRGIARAMFANLKAGRWVQGGSTLTQQLIKNFFLTNDRSFARKVNELPMAILLERHYSKDDILESYLNEIHLGQDGARAVHGFGLASHYYFAADLRDLDIHQMALLVGMAKGASMYDPRRRPEAALARRNVVLDVAVEQGVLTADEAAKAKKKPLDVVRRPPGGTSPHPAYFDLVRRQLREEYREEDLTSEGLKIYTTLIPHVQRAAEAALSQRVASLEKGRNFKEGTLQGAIVVTTNDGGEVAALAGGREARYAGFNRALDAKRQIGSLVKPAVFYSALKHPEKYTLATLVEDEPIRLVDTAGNVWQPGNYDKKFHGAVPLLSALAHSYNLPTAHIGLDIGVPEVIKTLKSLGVKDNINPFPSVLLGALEMTPLEVAQMYQTFANDGFRTPVRAIREVVTADGEPLQRYSLEVQRTLEAAPVHLTAVAMQHVVDAGTARAAYNTLSSRLRIAGKTGTTDDMRDSWFAGYTGDYVGVAWIGRDDNKPTGLSGANGALPVWVDLFAQLTPAPLELAQPEGVERAVVDLRSGMLAHADCGAVIELPFISGYLPSEGDCGGNPIGGAIENAVEWFKEVIE